MQLRPYQEKMIAEARQALASHRSILMVAATGAGKTALTVSMMAGAAARGKTSMFCVHRDTLLVQTSRALWEQKLPHGIIAAGKVMTQLPVQVASVQTLVRRLDKIKQPDLIVIDEAHRAAAGTYRKIIEAYPDAKIVGLTATPSRTDGSGLDDIFDALVLGPSVGELIADGYLSPYRIYAPPSGVDMSRVKMKMGDFDVHQMEEILDKPTITGDAVGHYQRIGGGKRCVVMCATIKHAMHVCDAYNAAGVRAEHIDGSTPSNERQNILARLESGETLVLTSVDLLIEGVDVPGIEVVQWLRPTASLIIYMQGNGRGFRKADGKTELVILDHVGNTHRHGLPDDPREWTLEGAKRDRRKKQKDDAGIKQCTECFAVYRPAPVCPVCGVKGETQRADLKVIDAELTEIDLGKERRKRKQEQAMARTIQQLVELGKRRGLAKPAEWAAIYYAARYNRKPSAAEFSEAKRYL
jgi:superfamily II DNA or RNA helicase